MAELKTRPTGASVAAFIAAAAGDPVRRDDCRALVQLMARVTGAKAVMWGPSIVGFGSYVYKRASGGDFEWPVAAFSPRKPDLVVYLMGHRDDPKLLARLGKYKAPGVSCLYIKRLADVDLDVLETLVERSVAKARAMEKSRTVTAKTIEKLKSARPKPTTATARPKTRKPARAR